MLLAGSAHAAPWTEWVGDYKTALTWRGCTTPGAKSATLALDAIDGALAIDLAPAKGGLRSRALVEDERGTLSAQDGDLAELSDRLVAFGVVVVVEAAVELGEDLPRRAPGRPDEEDPVEASFVGGVARRQPTRDQASQSTAFRMTAAA